MLSQIRMRGPLLGLLATGAASGCRGLPVEVAKLPNDVEELLVAGQALGGFLFMRGGYLPSEYVMLIRYDVWQYANDDVSKEWSRIFTPIFGILAEKKPDELLVICDEIAAYLAFLEQTDDPRLGAFSRRLKDYYAHPASATKIRAAKSMVVTESTLEGARRYKVNDLWNTEPKFFGDLIAGFEESLYGTVFPGIERTRGERGPLRITVKQQGCKIRLAGLKGVYWDCSRIGSQALELDLDNRDSQELLEAAASLEESFRDRHVMRGFG